MTPRHPADHRNLIVAVLLSAALIVAWQTFVEAPKRRELARFTALHEQQKKTQASEERTRLNAPEEAATPQPLETRLAASPRLPIASDTLAGSIALKGLRFDDLVLTRYRAELSPVAADEPEERKLLKSAPDQDRRNLVRLLSPAGDADAYFAQMGWLAGEGQTLNLPDENTVWQTDAKTLTPEKPVTLRWDNGAGLVFTAVISLDPHYMFSVAQNVENHTGAPVTLIPYAYINRAYKDAGAHAYILHEGPIGVLDGSLKEVVYKDLREKGRQSFDETGGWLGITDKYWLTALVPDETFRARFDYYQKNGQDRYQTDYAGMPLSAAPGAKAQASMRFFGGAKELDTLETYAKGNAQAGIKPIPLFDRAIDFGWFYFLTIPLAHFLTFLYRLVGNFGIAIILLTCCVKLVMFPLANKGYRSAAQMRKLQPQMQYIRDQYADDRMKMQKAMMELYKRERVNPAAGCLPIFIQIPVFFSLYKVLYVTIEMRHAPFFGWIRDLSAADPSNLFTLFGLSPWTPPSFFHLGLLPIVMGATMLVQMRLQPTPPDPTQATMMKIMPYFFTVMLARMPAGLVLYWISSNLISILQQYLITKRYGISNAPAPASADTGVV